MARSELQEAAAKKWQLVGTLARTRATIINLMNTGVLNYTKSEIMIEEIDRAKKAIDNKYAIYKRGKEAKF